MKPLDREMAKGSGTIMNRRAFARSMAAGALQVLVPPGLIVLIGRPIAPSLRRKAKELEQNLFGLEEAAEYAREGPQSVSPPPPEAYDPEQHLYAFVVDTSLCIGCGRCVGACKLENHIPYESSVTRTWIERYTIREDRTVEVDSPGAGIHSFPPLESRPARGDEAISRSFFVPKLCNQCTRPPCTQVCPVGATFSTLDGVVLVDRQRCIGCGYCIQVCPYGARFKHPSMHVAEKCTWCYHRICRQLMPVCVEVCPRGARAFGDLLDEKGPIRDFLRQRDIYVLKEDLGTKPKVFYRGYQLGVT